ncbi:hypothetical protein ACP4OV_001300 [Aristida adscensionis]
MAGVAFPAVACLLAAAAAVFMPASAQQVYIVGGELRGWRKPIANAESYNHWAARNRYHVGDFLEFRYEKNDSVMVVSREDYKICSTKKPAERFDGGETRYRLGRSGFVYFISGAPGHCGAGQRMTTRVMAQQGGRAPAPAESGEEEAPAMSPGDGEEGSYGPPAGGAGSGGVSFGPPAGGMKPGSGSAAGSSGGSGLGSTAATATPGKRSGAAAAVHAPSSPFGGSRVAGVLLMGALLVILAA